MAEQEYAIAKVKSGVPRNPGNPRVRVKNPVAMNPDRSKQPEQNPSHNPDRYDVTEINIYGP